MFLSSRKCQPCEGIGRPLTDEEIKKLLPEVPQWTHAREAGIDKIARQFVFKDFVEAIAFVNEIAVLAEEENHHPDIHISYKRVTLTLWTHVVHGLSENDFILAAKIDELR